MKTVRQWFEGVQNETMRTRLLEVMDADWGRLSVSKFSEAICEGFLWGSTAEGFDYWSNLVTGIEEFGL